jgi:hypothetical protein
MGLFQLPFTGGALLSQFSFEIYNIDDVFSLTLSGRSAY